MRDRDSQLIFESYKNRILVNEQAQALAIPAVAAIEALGATFTALAGTAVGAAVIHQAYKAYETLRPQDKSLADRKIEQATSLFQSIDTSLASQYGALNFIKSNTSNPEILRLEASQRDVMAFYSSVQNNVDYSDENLKVLARMAIKQAEMLANFAKTRSEDVSIAAIAALQAAVKALADSKTGGGGGEPPDNKDDKNKKDKKSLIEKLNEISTRNVIIIFSIFILIFLPALSGWITRQTIGAGKEVYKAVDDEITKADSATPGATPGATSSPTPRPLPIRPPLKGSSSRSSETPDRFSVE